MKTLLSVWPWLCALGGLVMCIWFARKFGWQGLLLKLTLLINGAFLMLLFMRHKIPGAYVPTDSAGLPAGTSPIVVGLVLLLISFLVADDWPMRWLMKPPVKWAMHIGEVLWFVLLFRSI
jgi:hypothetical protein